MTGRASWLWFSVFGLRVKFSVPTRAVTPVKAVSPQHAPEVLMDGRMGCRMLRRSGEWRDRGIVEVWVDGAEERRFSFLGLFSGFSPAHSTPRPSFP